MLGEAVDITLRKIPALSQNGLKIARAIHDKVLQGGKGARHAADLLHGVWLGHPLHPVLTDAAVGAWSIGSFFDLLSLVNGSQKSQNTADSLLEFGNVAALPTVLAGLADFSTIPKNAADTGLTHATLNAAAFSLYLASKKARDNDARTPAIALSTLATSLMLASAYLGGHMSYKQKVGVNHTDPVSGPQDWTPVLPAAQLQERQPVRVEAAGNPVLLYRDGNGRHGSGRHGHIHAIGAVCPHAGGPLEEGHFDGDCVQCPWHDSVFDLHDGRVVHGPSTYPVPNYEARIAGDQVEIRLARA